MFKSGTLLSNEAARQLKVRPGDRIWVTLFNEDTKGYCDMRLRVSGTVENFLIGDCHILVDKLVIEKDFDFLKGESRNEITLRARIENCYESAETRQWIKQPQPSAAEKQLDRESVILGVAGTISVAVLGKILHTIAADKITDSHRKKEVFIRMVADVLHDLATMDEVVSECDSLSPLSEDDMRDNLLHVAERKCSCGSYEQDDVARLLRRDVFSLLKRYISARQTYSDFTAALVKNPVSGLKPLILARDRMRATAARLAIICCDILLACLSPLASDAAIAKLTLGRFSELEGILNERSRFSERLH